MRNFLSISAVTLMVSAVSVGPVWSQLNILGVEADVSTDDGLSVDADVDILGDDGVDVDADADVGGDSGIVDADVDANIGGSGGVDASVDAGVGGDDGGLVDADVDIGIGGSPVDDDEGSGETDTPGTAPSGGGSTGDRIGSGGADTTSEGCITESAPLFSQLAAIGYSSADVASWASATQVQFIAINLCPGLDSQLGSGLLAQVATQVPVLESGLAQAPYGAADIVAISQTGSVLHVYVN